MYKKFEIFMVICILFASFFLARTGASLVTAKKTASARPCIVIDAGHGANDPGKIGTNGALEKDINLSIALKLKTILENKGIDVILTRDSDAILAEESSSNIKLEDMINRVKIISDAKPLFTISIHQNSYSDASAHGPQVFYYKESTEGKQIAQSIQDNLNEILQITSPRSIKANSDYYLLKKTPTPTIIVECGFLSNPTEADLLCDELYQDKIIRAIYFGVCDYLEAADIHLVP